MYHKCHKYTGTGFHICLHISCRHFDVYDMVKMERIEALSRWVIPPDNGEQTCRLAGHFLVLETLIFYGTVCFFAVRATIPGQLTRSIDAVSPSKPPPCHEAEA